MKTYTILICAFCAFALSSCSHERTGSAAVDAPNAPTTIARSAGSIYDVDMMFDDQNGEHISWQSLKGKVQVMAMVFTHCQATCPMITYEIKHAEGLLQESVRNNVGFTLISFDSKRDTGAQLRSYSDAVHLDDHWQLLHGSQEDIQTVANLFDVKYKELPTGDFSHSNVILVVDQQGHIVFRREGIERNPEQIAAIIKSLQ